MEEKEQEEEGGQADTECGGRLAWGLLLACLITLVSDEDECRAPQPPASAPMASVSTVKTASSFQCDCDEGFQPSAALTQCHSEYGQPPAGYVTTSACPSHLGSFPMGHTGVC